MPPKGAVLWRFSARFSGFRVVLTFRVALTLNQGCSAALGPADSEGLRLSAFRAPGFSVDDGAADQAVRPRRLDPVRRAHA